MSRKKLHIVILLGILLIGIILRLYKLGHQSLWNDEVWSVIIASSSVIKILTVSFWRDTHQPLYYLVLHFMTYFGKNEAILRLPSMIFGSLSIGLFYLILKNWFGRNYGYLGAFLMAISPFHIWYSQETRPYSMLLFCGLLSFFFLQKLLKHPTGQVRLAFVVSAAATFYCHSLSIVFYLFFAMYVFINRSSQGWKNWAVTFGAIILLIAPTFLPLLIAPPSHSADPFREVNLGELLYIFWAFGTGYTLGPSLGDLHQMGVREVIQQYLLLILASAGLTAALLLRGAYKLWTEERQTFMAAFLWFCIPIIFVVVGAVLSNHPINIRYVILGFPAFLIFLMIGIGELGRKWVSLSALVCLVFFSSYSLHNYYGNARYQRENNRGAADFLSKRATKDDMIMVSVGYAVKNLKHYYKQDANLLGYPPEGRYVDEQILEKELSEIFSDRERFWLFLSRTYHSDPKGLIKKYCDKNYRLAEYAYWNGVELMLYHKKSNGPQGNATIY